MLQLFLAMKISYCQKNFVVKHRTGKQGIKFVRRSDIFIIAVELVFHVLSLVCHIILFPGIVTNFCQIFLNVAIVAISI